ncbi:polyubiquitin-B-like [Juglans microcarpa x Juglans regia]|uniref:polyubiquitin-B-like n=1 Tax=Juglans microcarpa x Juglans regia TaxID=2249226 RepID=UPI001B7DFE0A|nr:polyubiquitin-B-like [Juglans microcarpa x Juglans regia]
MESPTNGSGCFPSSSVDSTEEEISLYLKTINTVSLKVKRYETISNLKSMICEKAGVSENVQELFFVGNQLKNDRRLVDYGIPQGSTLHLVLQNLVAMRIYVKIPSAQKIIAVDLRTYDTIQNIKSIIQAKEGIQPDRYTLIHNGKVLDNDWILAALNIPNESTIHLIFNPKDVIPIFVRTETGEILKLEVKVLHTVHDVKAIIESMTGVLENDFDLIYAEKKRVKGCKTLASYDIKEEANLKMSPAMMQIFVKTWSGKTITLNVQKCDTISDLWRKIVYKLRMCVPLSNMRIVFAGKRFNWGKDLASNGVQMHSTLHVVFLPSARIGQMKLADIGKPVQNFTTIRILKSLMEKKMKAPVKGKGNLLSGNSFARRSFTRRLLD